jgi:D-sedoheptulose 7-phosphate isomerase
MTHGWILDNLNRARETQRQFAENPANLETIEKAGMMLADALHSGHRALSCGNGGSLCDAMHFAEELSGRFRKDRPALAGLCLSDPAAMTCIANDYGYESVFARGVEAFGRSGDVLLAISTSGNSPNVLRAAETARQRGMKVIALLGRDGGKLKPLADVAIVVTSDTTERIQEVHIQIIHALIEFVERRLYPGLYP